MAVFLYQHKIMKNLSLFRGLLPFFFLFAVSFEGNAQVIFPKTGNQVYKILYFNPEVFPDIEEIKEPTNSAFFSAVSNNFIGYKNNQFLRINDYTSFDEIDPDSIQDFCKYNNADFVVLSKVKYFKVGLGKYIFSNQVVVSMKVYDSNGDLITETSYDTYRKNARMLGSAENSIRIGTNGAMKNIVKNFRKLKAAERNAS